ncbi:hypothetical protein NEF87_002783 [Candidatus Lokiarchaeum ossiferum]|uniref:PD(D/E)XK endonuclease domain-containing protein n=1 Tax=Candidatus Lokiarchaeum ossiferum TaxID=2951803 RepID=A0ABY6HSL3_9ARCH|nr:hypothetical protein NEF87_002783 [Candidatus Lokiarchaeum sp. B-35]
MKDKQNVGNSGEYYIAAFLSARNFIVTITLGRAIGYDLLAVNPSGKLIKISVKTRDSNSTHRFVLSEKSESLKSEDLFYAFVRTNKFESLPDFWMIPSKIVAEQTYNSHKKWLQEDSNHKDNTMRTFWVKNHDLFPKNWGETMEQYHNSYSSLL